MPTDILSLSAENVLIVTTPPEALPYLVEDRLFKTSIFSMSSKGILSTCDWPSGVVSGIPSSIILTPLIPKADFDPKPLIDILLSCA